MKNTELQRIFIKGGVLSPGEMKQVIELAETLNSKEVYLGSRQDIHMSYRASDAKVFDQFPHISMDTVSEATYENIVCSYVSADIFKNTSWVNGVKYLYILENFRYLPKLKINITDPKQQLVPLFSGELNFIASEHEDYWYLNLKLPHWNNAVFYPVLIYSYDIHKISKEIEEVYMDTDDVDELFELVNVHLDSNNRTIEKDLKISYEPFPYYEGMNSLGNNKYWLGLYWRNNKYSLQFLKELSDFCLDHKIGKICITPWKSLIIKGIYQEDKLTLEKFLGKRGINIRHSSLELNWHLPVGDIEALDLKEFIIQSIDEKDISTYGMTFGIGNSSSSRSNFTTVMIEKNKTSDVVSAYHTRPTFTILYSKNFDPNTQEYYVYAQEIDKIELPGLLLELSKMYFNQLGDSSENTNIKKSQKEAPLLSEVYRCKDCGALYDSYYGDSRANIDPNTSFEQLPTTYTCCICESAKNRFEKITKKQHE